MRRTVRVLSLLLLVAGLAVWLGRGANCGWTKTSVPVKVVDEVTGLEGINYEKRFVPGLDFVGAVLLGAGLLAGTSLFIRKPTPNPKT